MITTASIRMLRVTSIWHFEVANEILYEAKAK